MRRVRASANCLDFFAAVSEIACPTPGLISMKIFDQHNVAVEGVDAGVEKRATVG
jgi:hypothetical protein